MTATQRWTLTVASLASLMVSLDALVVATALNTIRVQLGASIEELEWTVNAYTLAFATLLLTASAIGDRFGRRRIMVVGLVVFTAASAACALAPTPGVLIVARAVQGAGAAMVMPTALALVSVAFPSERRGAAMGILAGVTGIAVLGGPVIGGAVVQGIAWPWIFWLNVPIGALLVLLCRARVAESVGRRRGWDAVGLGTSALGICALVWGVVHSTTVGWASPSVLVALALGVVLLAAFVLVEGRAAHPMLPLRLFARHGFGAANVGGLLLSASIFGAAFFLSQYLQAGLRLSPLSAGMHMLPWTASLFLVAPIAGAQVNRFGARMLVFGGLFAQALGFAWVALAVASGGGYPAMIAPMVLAGIGVSTAMPAVQNAAVSAVEPGDIGTASGVYNAVRQLGGAVGIAVLASVFAGVGGDFAMTATLGRAFEATMLVAAALSVVGAGAGMFVAGRRGLAAGGGPGRERYPLGATRLERRAHQSRPVAGVSSTDAASGPQK
ncbi:DHA2 family efflux MFS transporter permease subunit [Humibacter antri]